MPLKSLHLTMHMPDYADMDPEAYQGCYELVNTVLSGEYLVPGTYLPGIVVLSGISYLVLILEVRHRCRRRLHRPVYQILLVGATRRLFDAFIVRRVYYEYSTRSY